MNLQKSHLAVTVRLVDLANPIPNAVAHVQILLDFLERLFSRVLCKFNLMAHVGPLPSDNSESSLIMAVGSI